MNDGGYAGMDRLRDKVVLVTGATRGIGRGIAEFLAGEGARVVVSGRNEIEGNTVVADIRSAGGEALFVRADISLHSDAIRLIDESAAWYGRLDGLVNNAGVFPYAALLDVTEADFDTIFAVNVKGAFFCTQQAVRFMRLKGGGSIVNIGSTHWEAGNERLPAYACSKGALHTLTHHVAHHFAPYGIRCNWITVGWVVTQGELARVQAEGHDLSWLEDNAAGRIPSGKFQTPEDMGRACVFFLSDESLQVTGTDMEVNGGFRPF